MKMSPCKDCKNRYPGCHDKCLAFIDWTQERQVVKDKLFKEKEAKYALNNMHINRMRSFGEKHRI